MAKVEMRAQRYGHRGRRRKHLKGSSTAGLVAAQSSTPAAPGVGISPSSRTLWDVSMNELREKSQEFGLRHPVVGLTNFLNN